MTSRASSVWSLRAMLALSALVGACSEEPRSVTDHCKDIPLYRNVHDDETDTWVRVAVDGGPLSAEDQARIEDELNRQGPRCLTPTGPSAGGASAADAASGGGGAGGGVTDAATSD